MPLAKNITAASDITVPYWVHAATMIDHLGTGNVQVVWNGYKDKTAFDAGKAPVTQESFSIPIPGGGFPATFTSYIVAQTKLQAKFSGATDTP